MAFPALEIFRKTKIVHNIMIFLPIERVQFIMLMGIHGNTRRKSSDWNRFHNFNQDPRHRLVFGFQRRIAGSHVLDEFLRRPLHIYFGPSRPLTSFGGNALTSAMEPSTCRYCLSHRVGGLTEPPLRINGR